MAESNCLIVPLKVKVMYEPGDNCMKYGNIRWKMETLMVNPIGGAVEPEAFEDRSAFPKGMYLQWILPDAFTKGTLCPDGSSQFPRICNFYQVYRFIEDTDGNIVQGVSEKKWLVKSRNDLTAVQNADAAYASNYQQCGSSLGLYDDLKGMTYLDGKLCYGVVGFYECEEDNPLSDMKDLDAFSEYLAAHEFSVQDKHMCQDMLWVGGTRIPICSDGPRCDCPVPDMDIRVAVGNNSMEAFAALAASELTSDLNEKAQIEKRLLQLLYQKTGEANSELSEYLLKNEIHNRAFLADNIGKCYETDNEREQEIISQLNQYAYEYNRLKAELRSLQQEVYFIWYMSVVDSYGRPMSQRRIQQYLDLKDKYIQVIPEYIRNIHKKKRKLKKLLSKCKHVKEVDEELFWKPSAPCVLFMGEGLQRKYLQGYDTYFQEDNLLPCYIWQKDMELLRNRETGKDFLSKAEWGTCIHDWEDPWSPLFFEWSLAFYPDSDAIWTLEGMDYRREKVGVSKQDGFSGKGILTPFIADYMSDVLQEYKESFKPNCTEYKMIEELSKKMERMDVLSQTMGGLPAQLYAKDETYQAECRKTGVLGDEYDQAMVAMYQNQNIYSPMYNSEFYWKRNGIGEILRLRILDGYGRYRTLEQNRFQCVFPEYFRKGIEDMPVNRFLMPPRIMQPHRIQVCPVNEGAPVRAWLMPNLFDGTLAIYNGDGKMIGYMYSQIIKKEGIRRKEARFMQFNSQGDGNLEISSEIQCWMDGILSHNDDSDWRESNALEQLLFYLEGVFIQNPKENLSSSLPVLLAENRVIALVDVLIHLDCMGWREHSPKQIMDSDSSYGDENGEEFDIFCGDSNYPKEGLFGFYVLNKKQPKIENMKQLHMCWKDSEKSYLKLDNSVRIRDQGEEVSLLLMMDPQKSVVITSGILPNYFFRLNTKLVDQIVSQIDIRMEVDTFFNAGESISVPLPQSGDRKWSWECPALLEQEENEKLILQECPITNMIEGKDYSNESKRIVEGWIVYKKQNNSKGS